MMLQTITDNKEMITRNSETDFITVTNTDGHLVFMGLRKNIKCFDRLKQVSNRRFETIPGQTYKIADKTPELQTEPEPQISPERQSYLAGAYQRYLAEQAAKATPAAMPAQPKQMSVEEKLQYDWKHSPSLRKEFVSFGSYQAYMRAAEAGRCRVYGQGTSRA